MREFLKRATAAKIDRLSQLVTDSFRYLLRKKSLVERVIIDPGDFSITLVDTAGNTVPKDRLSEGEKQIFAISVLWGLSQASARPLPAIIDTPMGRLDAEHRNQLVERYFPHASHQVIILSTDTEIECEYFERLQKHIARAYHIVRSKTGVKHDGQYSRKIKPTQSEKHGRKARCETEAVRKYQRQSNAHFGCEATGATVSFQTREMTTGLSQRFVEAQAGLSCCTLSASV